MQSCSSGSLSTSISRVYGQEAQISLGNDLVCWSQLCHHCRGIILHLPPHKPKLVGSFSALLRYGADTVTGISGLRGRVRSGLMLSPFTLAGGCHFLEIC